jgi:hypothetical protein
MKKMWSVFLYAIRWTLFKTIYVQIFSSSYLSNKVTRKKNEAFCKKIRWTREVNELQRRIRCMMNKNVNKIEDNEIFVEPSDKLDRACVAS